MDCSTFWPCRFHHDWLGHFNFAHMFVLTMDPSFGLQQSQTTPQSPKNCNFAHFLGANGSIIFHHPWAVAPWRDMWPMWNFLGVLELRATTDGRQVSDSTPNHPIVINDHDFVLKFVATWGTPILRNLRYFLVADEMLQLMAVQKPENGLVQKQRGSGRVLGVSAWWIPLAKKPG